MTFRIRAGEEWRTVSRVPSLAVGRAVGVWATLAGAPIGHFGAGVPRARMWVEVTAGESAKETRGPGNPGKGVLVGGVLLRAGWGAARMEEDPASVDPGGRRVCGWERTELD